MNIAICLSWDTTFLFQLYLHLVIERPLNIAHRGASGLAPENTLAAFEKAIEIGVDRTEMDLRQTIDG